MRAAQRMLSSRLASYMGVGSAHHGPAGLVRTLSESRDAAQLAMARKESGRFLHLGRLGTAQLLLAWTGTELFQPAAQALLEPLQDQAGDLVPTLVAYLDSESNLSEAAAVLGVHRNTVASRIQRVEQLLDVSLKDADERLALHLAARTALRRSADPS